MVDLEDAGRPRGGWRGEVATGLVQALLEQRIDAGSGSGGRQLLQALS